MRILILFSVLLGYAVDALGVMSIDLGSEWMKGIVFKIFPILLYTIIGLSDWSIGNPICNGEKLPL